MTIDRDAEKSLPFGSSLDAPVCPLLATASRWWGVGLPGCCQPSTAPQIMIFMALRLLAAGSGRPWPGTGVIGARLTSAVGV